MPPNPLLCAYLDDAARRAFVDSMMEVVVKQGEVEVKDGDESTRSRTIGAGGSCGELALLTGQPRSASITVRLRRLPIVCWLFACTRSLRLSCELACAPLRLDSRPPFPCTQLLVIMSKAEIETDRARAQVSYARYCVHILPAYLSNKSSVPADLSPSLRSVAFRLSDGGRARRSRELLVHLFVHTAGVRAQIAFRSSGYHAPAELVASRLLCGHDVSARGVVMARIAQGARSGRRQGIGARNAH
eukprot:6213273-Pleurochrysis_carterae.AAC.7